MADDQQTRPAEQTRAALREDSAEDLYEHAPCGYLSTYPDGTIARVNETFLSWTGHERDDLVGHRRFVDLLTPGGRIYHETHFAPLLQMQRTVRSIALDLVRADGSRMPVLVNSDLRTDEADQPLAVRTTVFDATDRKSYETELLAARRRAEQAAARLRVVEQVVAELAAVPSVAGVAEVIGKAGTTAFGAAASAVWLGDEGDATSGAFVWADGASSPGLAAHTSPITALPRSSSLHAGETVVIPDGSTDESLDHIHGALGEAGGTVILTPLAATDRVLGVLAMRLTHSDTPDPDELRLLHTLGGQAGQALERARLFDVQSTVAATLQLSMLPRFLPDDLRVSLSASYRPAVEGLDVGGDWYDAFCLDHDRIALVVGDVVGRGLPAAAVMGQLRSAVRALATTHGGPALLLTRLDSFVEGVEAADTATMAYVEVDLVSGTATFACAGHPPPVLVDREGRSQLLWGGRSAPLGAHFGAGTRAQAEVRMTPGDRLMLYTDGLVERRDEALDKSIDALALELGRWSERPFAGLAENVVDSVLGTGPTGDDVCLLALAFQERSTFTATVPAEPGRLAGLRRDLGGWLETQGVDGEGRAAVVLATSEAVGNAIEHGYWESGEGTVGVLATVEGSDLRLRVRDTGRWRTPRPSATRGRGLQIIESLMDRVVVERGDGTTVMMSRSLEKGAQP